MRTTKAISISLQPSEIRQARLLARQTNRSLSGVFREGLKLLREGRVSEEYTLAQRRIIDAAEEAIASMKTNLTWRAVANKAKA
jgi:hypothetical protein